MQVSIVGDLSAAVPFLNEVLASAADELAVGCVRGALDAELTSRQRMFTAVASVESACVGSDDGLVAIAESSADESIRLARIAVQSGRHVLIFEPEDVSPAWAFELQLLQDESTTSIIPVIGRMRLNSSQNDDSAQSLAAGEIQQIHLDLSLPAPAELHLARTQRQALDIVSATGVRYSSVIAVDQRSTAGALIQRTLTLGSAVDSEHPAPPAVILIRPASSGTEDQLTVTATTGTAVRESVQAAPAILSVARELISQQGLAKRWMSDAAATLELDYAANRSLKRRRAIDVHHDSGSERSVFKSQMTAIGCIVLLLMMMGLVGYLVLAQLFQPPEIVLQIARALWIAPALLYLLAQLLLPLARDRKSGTEKSTQS